MIDHLTAEEINLRIYNRYEESLLGQMYRFKGLKALCLEFTRLYLTDGIIHPDCIMSRVVCPELEHAALFNVDKLPPAAINMFPKLKSLYLKLTKAVTDYSRTYRHGAMQ
jgi:hypothetical protein